MDADCIHSICNCCAVCVAVLLLLSGLAGSVLGQSNGVYREVYSGISGSTIPDLTNNAAFPNSPTSTDFITDFFDAAETVADADAERIRALVAAPITGTYIFWIS